MKIQRTAASSARTRASALLLAGLILIALATPASAGVVIGVKGGVSFASQDIDGAPVSGLNMNNRTGSAFGANLEFEVLPVLWIRFEPMYVQRGGEMDWPEGFDEFDNTQKYDYFSVPVNVKVVANFVSVRPYAFGGVTVGWVLSDELELVDGTSTDIELETFDFGVDIGAGVDFVLMPKVSIGIDARYTYGLTDNNKFDSITANNRTTLILAGVNVTL